MRRPRASAKRSTRATAAKRPISDATRADNEKLRAKLRTADMRKFDDVIGKAFRTPG